MCFQYFIFTSRQTKHNKPTREGTIFVFRRAIEKVVNSEYSYILGSSRRLVDINEFDLLFFEVLFYIVKVTVTSRKVIQNRCLTFLWRSLFDSNLGPILLSTKLLTCLGSLIPCVHVNTVLNTWPTCCDLLVTELSGKKCLVKAKKENDVVNNKNILLETFHRKRNRSIGV